MHLYLWSCFFLLSTAVICVIGLFAHSYKENLIQNAGMCLLALSCPSRIVDLWEHQYVPFDWFAVHAGVGLVAIGIFVKICYRRRHERMVELQKRVAQALTPTDLEWQRFNRGELATMPPERRRANGQHPAMH